jgi:hypothetical protein
MLPSSSTIKTRIFELDCIVGTPIPTSETNIKFDRKPAHAGAQTGMPPYKIGLFKVLFWESSCATASAQWRAIPIHGTSRKMLRLSSLVVPHAGQNLVPQERPTAGALVVQGS